MKRYFLLCGCLLAMFASSCSDEVIESGGTGMNIPAKQENLGKIVVTLPADTRTRTGIADDELTHDDLHGTVDVNQGYVLVFSKDRSETSQTYKYESSIDLTFEEKTFDNPSFGDNCETGGNTRFTASAKFEPDAKKLYILYAYAYHSEGVGKFEIPTDIGKQLQMENELSKEEVASVSLSLASTQSKTSEIYGGFLDEYVKNNEGSKPYPEAGNFSGTSSSESIPVIGDDSREVLNYGGPISRQTGRFEITIDLTDEEGKYTDEIADIGKAYMVVEKYSNTIPVGMKPKVIQTSGSEGYLDFPNPFDTQETDIVEAVPSNNALVFQTDIFPFQDSEVFIKIVNKDESYVKHQIRVVDKWIDSNFLGVMVPVAKESLITLPPNHWISLKASYKQLISNWTIDFEWGSKDFEVDMTLKPEN